MVVEKVYAVAGAKGGIGKTTTSINLGTAFSMAGYSTVVVELDLAMANLVDFVDIDVNLDDEPTIHDVLAGETEVDNACYRCKEGLTVVPSGTDLLRYTDTDLSHLPDVIETLRHRYDVVLLDTPAGLSQETVRPIQLADEVLLISTPRVASVRNAKNTLTLTERVDTPTRGLILTKSGTGASPGADQIAEFLGVELLGHVPEDDAVPHSQDHGVPVVEYAPQSGAAIAYRKIRDILVDPERRPSHRQTRSDPSGDTDGETTTDGMDQSTPTAVIRSMDGKTDWQAESDGSDAPSTESAPKRTGQAQSGTASAPDGGDESGPGQGGIPESAETETTVDSRSDWGVAASERTESSRAQDSGSTDADATGEQVDAADESDTTDADAKEEQVDAADESDTTDASEGSSLGSRLRSLVGL